MALASSSGAALQPATADTGASAASRSRGAAKPAVFTVASFNCGSEQGAMMGKASKTHCQTLGTVAAQIVEETDADVFFGCEVGHFREGLPKAKLDAGEIMRVPFGDGVRTAVKDAYLAVWGFRGASQPAADSGRAPEPVAVSLHGDVVIHNLPFARLVDAAITRFNVMTPKTHVIVGNMHTVAGKTLPSLRQEKEQ